ncbi:MAG: UDP-glucose 4-epimerase GalE [Cryomorphaceae bacterium]|nr:MAG: UDP-glucose 4-epimerase GalE [Cryomorphaceae bacterium]
MAAKKILVTGGAGFIGSHTAVALSVAGYEPVVMDNFSNSERAVMQGIRKLAATPVHLLEADCCNVEALRTVFRDHQPAGVIHFAAFKAVGESVQQPVKYFQNNIGSLTALLQVMPEFSVNDLVFSSSCTVYGVPDSLPVTENAPVKPAMSPYGYTKQVCEEAIHYAAAADGKLRSTLLRYFNPIGAHPSGEIGELPLGVPNNLVPFITQTAAGMRRELSIFGRDYDTPDGTCIRDYIHVMDLAEAHVRALGWLSKAEEGRVEVFNVGTGKGQSVQEVVDTFEEVTGVKVRCVDAQRRPGDVPVIYADASCAEKELNWRATRTMADALRDAWNWQQRIGQGKG